MITKAGEKWFQDVCLKANYVPDGAQRYDVTEFWLRAFVAEVERRAEHRWPGAWVKPTSRHQRIGVVLTELKRELLGK
jgi:hypothetical protein